MPGTFFYLKSMEDQEARGLDEIDVQIIEESKHEVSWGHDSEHFNENIF